MSDRLFAIGAVFMLMLMLITPTDIQKGEKDAIVKEYCTKYPKDLRCQMIRFTGV